MDTGRGRGRREGKVRKPMGEKKEDDKKVKVKRKVVEEFEE